MDEKERVSRKRRGAMCNHEFNSPNNTLIKIATRRMIYPPTDEYYCLYCKHIFKYQKENEEPPSFVKEQNQEQRKEEPCQ